MKTLAIIPARGGSKRIPNKNIKDFCGSPMISHVLKAADMANIFEKIHVSTDSERISAVVEDLGFNVDFQRPTDISDDYATVMDVLRFTVAEYEARNEFFDIVCLLYATSPLITPTDIKTAYEKFIASDKKRALLSVTAYPTPVEKAWIVNEDQALIPKNSESFSKRTQDLIPAYYDAGMFCFYTPDYIKQTSGAGNSNGFRAFVVPSYRVTDIDEPEDWERAELLFKAAQNI